MTPVNSVLLNNAPAQIHYTTLSPTGGNVTVATPTAAVRAPAEVGGSFAYDPMVFTAPCGTVTICQHNLYACTPPPKYCTAGPVVSEWACPNGAASCWSSAGGAAVPLTNVHAVVFNGTNAFVYEKPAQFDDLQHIAVSFALLAVVAYCKPSWFSGKTLNSRMQLHLNWCSAITALLATSAPLRHCPGWIAPLAAGGGAVHAVRLFVSKGGTEAHVKHCSATTLLAYTAIILNLPEQSIGVHPASFARFVLGLGCLIHCGSVSTDVSVALAIWCAGAAIYPQVIEAVVEGAGSNGLLAAAISGSAFAAGQFFE